MFRVPFILEREAYWKPAEGQRHRRSGWNSCVDPVMNRDDMGLPPKHYGMIFAGFFRERGHRHDAGCAVGMNEEG
jgi:hypothetical protein